MSIKVKLAENKIIEICIKNRLSPSDLNRIACDLAYREAIAEAKCNLQEYRILRAKNLEGYYERKDGL